MPVDAIAGVVDIENDGGGLPIVGGHLLIGFCHANGRRVAFVCKMTHGDLVRSPPIPA